MRQPEISYDSSDLLASRNVIVHEVSARLRGVDQAVSKRRDAKIDLG